MEVSLLKPIFDTLHRVVDINFEFNRVSPVFKKQCILKINSRLADIILK